MAKGKLTRRDRFSVEWQYAKQCWDAIVRGAVNPPAQPMCSVFERDEDSTDSEKFVQFEPIKPAQIIYQGVIWYGK